MKLSLLNFLALSLLIIVLACGNNTKPKHETKTDTLSNKTIEFKDNSFNQTARFLAGMPQLDSNSFTNMSKMNSWKKYSNKVDSIWNLYDKNRLEIMRTWYNGEFAKYRAEEKNIYYPFSGPDWLNIYTIYPNGNLYVMSGLELVGNNPNPKTYTDLEMQKGLDGLLSGLTTLIERGYFITSYMGKDFYSTKLNGVIPVLYFFLARTNCNIINQEFIGLDKTGKETVLTTAMRTTENIGYTRGVKITFKHANSDKVGTLYYYSCDLAENGIIAHPGYVNFVKQHINNSNTFLKAASYLMHGHEFVSMKDLVLSKSATILTDDSGLPLRAVKNDKWNLTFYGKYTGPIKNFPYISQPELNKIYNEGASTIKPIPFGTGYKWRLNESNLMFCVKK